MTLVGRHNSLLMFRKKEVREYLEKKAEHTLDRLEKTPAQKLIVAILVVATLSILFLGYLQIRGQLEVPFFVDKLIEAKAKIRGPREFLEFYKTEQRNRSDLLQLQQQDSDNDGLTDYQELYIYKTNQYSADTDSDGVSDGDEISKGTDPRCPTGSICDEEGFIVPANEPSSSGTNVNSSLYPTDTSGGDTASSSDNSTSPAEIDLGPLVSGEAASPQLQSFSGDDKEVLKTYFKSLSAADIRTLLEQQGFPTEQIAALSDEDLKKALESMINSL